MIEGIVVVETPLSVQQRFRLVEIAHETTSLAVERHALRLLEEGDFPLVEVRK